MGIGYQLARIIVLATSMIALPFLTRAQETIQSRVILIGDAGEIDAQQDHVLEQAASMILPGKTTVMFLGDNVYPRGFGLNETEATASEAILRRQFTPMRKNGAPAYFIPGNHDWDRMGKNGLEKIKRQWSFLDSQQDSLLKLVPANGCPDPVAIELSEKLVIIAYDSEWWLFPFNKVDPETECSCSTPKEVSEKMAELFYNNRYKVILLADHHPFQSYGHHGGYFSLKDHLFPFTAAEENLYIPLPVIGSLYPLLRGIFKSPEDIGHPLYDGMIKQVDNAFEGFPNLIHVAGHDHGLQFIKSEQIQVVSGSGSKHQYVKKGKHSLFAEKKGGFVVIDQLSGNDLEISYHLAGDSLSTKAFSYRKPYVDFAKIERSAYKDMVLADSVTVAAHPAYDNVSKLHRVFFGENYRKEWATPTKLPVIRLSSIKGGLTPTQRGGGHQSISIRLVDKQHREWVLRSVNKYPEVLLPEPIRETFAKDIINDAMSAQHPYSAMVVPVVANAVGVPHSKPLIGVVAPDTALGIFQQDFVNTVCLLEEREPAGESDNSAKMYKQLTKDNDNHVDSNVFLKARLLDLFLGDWDRHEDQWRWVPEKTGKGKRYLPVPRDRDQVFRVTNGVFPAIASLPWIAPFLHNFSARIKQTNAFFVSSNMLNKRLLNQFSYSDWMKVTDDFVRKVSDSVLEAALLQLPAESYRLKHDILLKKWQGRRAALPDAMKGYYRFLNRVVDLQTSDKSEFVSITDTPDAMLRVTINKLNKSGEVKEQLYERAFDPKETKELRIYFHDGNDSLVVNNHSPIKVRVVGRNGEKSYNILHSRTRVNVYDKKDNFVISGDAKRAHVVASDDSSTTAYVADNPYNKIIPNITVGFNADDGFLAGASVKFINQGFRKTPYASTQQLSFLHSFSTKAFRFRFQGEWLKVFGKTDVLFGAKALAPENTQNFFGLGNNTSIDKTGNYKRYYRTRFSIFQFDPAIRWQIGSNGRLSAGPSLQVYRFSSNDNAGRFINNVSQIHSYDSATIAEGKTFAGIILNYTLDVRNDKLIPKSGAYLAMRLQSYKQLGTERTPFVQFIPEFSFYKDLGRQSNLVIANRIGGGITFGKPAFFQALFLGGQENLLGYRQYRFAGESMVYNNFEVRLRLAQLGSYILPGQLGLVAFYDAGKVWAKNYNSHIVHQGTGGGLYFAPAQMAVFQIVAGYSQEGWYPYFTMGFRF